MDDGFCLAQIKQRLLEIGASVPFVGHWPRQPTVIDNQARQGIHRGKHCTEFGEPIRVSE